MIWNPSLLFGCPHRTFWFSLKCWTPSSELLQLQADLTVTTVREPFEGRGCYDAHVSPAQSVLANQCPMNIQLTSKALDRVLP